jgi:hypothetical protein
MSLGTLLHVSDYKLTSMGGFSIGFPVRLPLVLGINKFPVEFTNSKTGVVSKFSLDGIHGSVSAIPLNKWLSTRLSATFSPSTFPSSGELLTMQAALDPFYIDAIRGYFGVILQGGLDLGVAGSVGVIIFSILPPILILPEASMIAICFYKSAGLATASGLSGEQDLFRVS